MRRLDVPGSDADGHPDRPHGAGAQVARRRPALEDRAGRRDSASIRRRRVCGEASEQPADVGVEAAGRAGGPRGAPRGPGGARRLLRRGHRRLAHRRGPSPAGALLPHKHRRVGAHLRVELRRPAVQRATALRRRGRPGDPRPPVSSTGAGHRGRRTGSQTHRRGDRRPGESSPRPARRHPCTGADGRLAHHVRPARIRQSAVRAQGAHRGGIRGRPGRAQASGGPAPICGGELHKPPSRRRGSQRAAPPHLSLRGRRVRAALWAATAGPATMRRGRLGHLRPRAVCGDPGPGGALRRLRQLL